MSEPAAPLPAGDDLSQMDLAQKDLTLAIGHAFTRPALLTEALTHPSAVAQSTEKARRKRRKPPPRGYDRLEFLGDRVLGLVVADLLWRRHPDETEGQLSRRHAQLVRRETLARVANEIGLQRHVILASSDAAAGTAGSPRVLSDVCEAIIAAIYLDSGYAAAFGFVERFWARMIAEVGVPPEDPKNALQAWAERRGLGLPVYRLVATQGPEHALRFTVAISVGQSEEVSATASSKRAAEAEAAASLLSLLTHNG
jgi:ribonuclease-3